MKRSHVTVPCAALALALAACDSGGQGPPGAMPGPMPALATIPGASFQFGFTTGRLQSAISTPPFAISKTPTTVGEYRGCVAVGACSAPALRTPACSQPRVPVVEGSTYDASPSADGLPVTCVTPRQAIDYCTWVGGALPTIEQWVYAARGPNVQQFAWGQAPPDCSKHQRALPIRGPGTGCCAVDSCDPSTYYTVGQRPDVASPEGLLDVLLTPAELLRGRRGSPVPACSAESGACVVLGLHPGAIDFAAPVSSDVDQDASYTDPGTVSSFRCAFEVNP